MLTLDSASLIPEPDLVPGNELLAEGRAMARDWQVGLSAFLSAVGVPSEAAFKRREMARGRIMLHAQSGYRDIDKSCRAYAEIYEACRRAGVTIDRYGLCLDWSMGYAPAMRARGLHGTGMIMRGPEDFIRLANSAPVSPHFGDFVLGFPGSVENTQAALVAGSTSIGNLGQFFTFRLPHWDDDITATVATVKALGLIAAQEVEMLVHSNLDDGYAAVFTDLASSLGMVLIEKRIVEGLIGASVGHCFGHHFSDPVTRLAFQRALKHATDTPGTYVYGDTMSYRGGPRANFASLAKYFLIDVLGQRLSPSGHALNAVPVTENSRIPEIDEVIDAQLFAGRMIEHAAAIEPLVNIEPVDRLVAEIVAGGERFCGNVFNGLRNAGFDVEDPFELLLALRLIGGKRLEEWFGAGRPDAAEPRGRRPIVQATTIKEIGEMASARLAAADPDAASTIAAASLTAVVGTTDVHEHGKLPIEKIFKGLKIRVVDGRISADPDDLAGFAVAERADFIAVSTYNGVALTYLNELKAEMERRDLAIPVLIGGWLNQVPEGSNTSLPVDVGDRLKAAGARVCRDVDDAIPILLDVARRTETGVPKPQPRAAASTEDG